MAVACLVVVVVDNMPKSKRNKLAAWIVSLLGLTVGLIPFWVWLTIYNLASPEGFWQKAFLFGGGLFLLGGAQVVMLVLTFVFIWGVWEALG